MIELIFRDFLDEHNLIADEINWHRVKAVTLTKRMETHVHIDAYGEQEDRWPIQWKEFNLWIPMHDTDNLVLAVGDASGMHDVNCVEWWHRIKERKRRQDCAERDDFGNIKWYHQPRMRPQDAIWLAAKDIPHCAVDRYFGTYHMYYRSALIIHFRPIAVNVRSIDGKQNDND